MNAVQCRAVISLVRPAAAATSRAVDPERRQEPADRVQARSAAARRDAEADADGHLVGEGAAARVRQRRADDGTGGEVRNRRAAVGVEAERE